ncbi:MAG: molybdenum cofactor biosynthesis protein B [Gammaproteobacteria bacterium]|nr:MAG: molybdenum cofactor biosynthesis protein B [Gammaproteobacteria bacterium]
MAQGAADRRPPGKGPGQGAQGPGRREERAFLPLGVAVLTVSDSRSEREDTSGRYLAEAVREAGHRLVDRALCRDERWWIRARLCAWLVNPLVQVVLITGGTGFHPRDGTPEAVGPLLDREVPGFGELFRALSFRQVGSSTVQSRALAGLANGRLVACLPGATRACRLAWEEILRPQLDSRHRPCSFAELLAGGPAGGEAFGQDAAQGVGQDVPGAREGALG